MSRRARRLLAAVVALLVLFGSVAILLRTLRIEPLQDRVERAVISTLQRETPENFLVTGRLDIATSIQVTSTRVLLPDMLDMNLGSAKARVRVPGRVSYGFSVSTLDKRHVVVEPGGVVRLVLPDLEIYAVEPRLEEVQIETESGWLRPSQAERRVTEEALRHIRQTMGDQGRAHLRDSVQPRVNTARALQALLEPVLRAAGIVNPQIEIDIGSELLMRPSDRES